MPDVTIVGGGISGLTAALRLLERGFDVTLIEKDEHLGGMMGALREGRDHFHEHSYHMFPNWYYNFWKIVEEVGAIDNFAPRDGFEFLRRGEFPHTTAIVNVGALSSIWRNTLSGVAPIPDMFLYLYSLIDILSEPVSRDEFLDYHSVNGFMRSRPYATNIVAQLHHKTWETVWAIPAYGSSLASYQTFIKYGTRNPAPGMWMMTGNKHEALITHIESRLKDHKGRFRMILRTCVTEAKIDDSGRIANLTLCRLSKSPSFYPDQSKPVGRPHDMRVGGDLLLAVSPPALAELIKGNVYQAAPELGGVLKLRAEPMASVELLFTRKLPDIPNNVVVLLDGKYEMTFLDSSQLWGIHDHTELYVTVSDLETMKNLPSRREDGTIDLEDPTTVLDYVLRELREFLPFDVSDINVEQTDIHTNTGDPLFLNEPGSWQYRPGATTAIPNLYLAGVFCRTFVDVATVEGAVVSGLRAAEEIRRKAGIGAAIQVIEPDYYPQPVFAALKALWAPYAYAAKAWATANEELGIGPGEIYPTRRDDGEAG